MCVHEHFQAAVSVNRLHDELGNMTRFTAEVEVRCSDCDEPFVFEGLPAGLLLDQPTVDMMGTQLRCPIRPLTEGIDL